MIDKKRCDVKVKLRHAVDGEVQRRHDRSDGDRIDRFEIQVRQRKKISRQDAPLITGTRAFRGQTPMRDELRAVKHAERSIRIANVDSQQHKNRG